MDATVALHRTFLCGDGQRRRGLSERDKLQASMAPGCELAPVLCCQTQLPSGQLLLAGSPGHSRCVGSRPKGPHQQCPACRLLLLRMQGLILYCRIAQLKTTMPGHITVLNEDCKMGILETVRNDCLAG